MSSTGKRVDLDGIDVARLRALPCDDDGTVDLPTLLAHVTRIDPATLNEYELLELATLWDRVVSVSAMARGDVLAEFARRPERGGPPAVGTPKSLSEGPRPFVVDEVAARLGWGMGRGGQVVSSAVFGPHRLPALVEQARVGRISADHVSIAVSETNPLSDEVAQEVDRRLSERAADVELPRWRTVVRRCVRQVDPATAEQRRERAVQQRSVRFEALDDGTAALWAILPSLDAARLAAALDAAARSRRAAGDERTLDQLRADLLSGAVIAGAGARSNVEVQVMVPASTLLGMSDEPAFGVAPLMGRFELTAEQARMLARDATWRAILVDPFDGSVRGVSSRTYRPGAVLSRQVMVRDQQCRYPGCTRAAVGCDLDHTVPYDDGGPTSVDNLAALCRRHHRLKHHGDAVDPPVLQQGNNGRLHWRLPTGHEYDTQPPMLWDTDDAVLRAARHRGRGRGRSAIRQTDMVWLTNVANIQLDPAA
jgi:hypothetical protein